MFRRLAVSLFAEMRPYVQIGVRVLIVVLFIAAGIPKIIMPQDFALILFRYHLLPDSMVNAVALVVPWLEGLAAVALLSPALRRAGAACLVCMLLAATTAITISLARGLDIDCGCFTLKPGQSPVSLWSISRNLLLILLVLWAGRGKILPQPASRP